VGIELPHFSDDLLTALAEKFPDKCPHVMDAERVIWLKAGAASVVAYLKDQRERQKRLETGGGSETPLQIAGSWLE
jgi:hypothetical protein